MQLTPSSLDEHTRQCSLSGREEELIGCIFRGMSNAAISEELGLSLQVVKNYLGRAFLKLKVTSRYELIAQAGHLGGLKLWTYNGEPYVEPPPPPPTPKYSTAEEKRQAQMAQAKKVPLLPDWVDKFTVEPTIHECRVIGMILAEPEISAISIAKRIPGSSERGVCSTLSRIYNKAGVKSRAGLIAFLLGGRHDRAHQGSKSALRSRSEVGREAGQRCS